MTDPPSLTQYTHLGELLTLMRQEMQRGFADLKDELSDRVSVDVYEADKRLAEERADRAAADLATVRAAVDRAEERQTAEKLRADDARQADIDRRAADRRMVWGALLSGLLSLAVGVALLVGKFLTT